VRQVPLSEGPRNPPRSPPNGPYSFRAWVQPPELREAIPGGRSGSEGDCLWVLRTRLEIRVALPTSSNPTPSDDLTGSFMAGLKDKRGFIDKDRLDLSERKAVEFWMKRWGVTQDQLTAAHRKVGRMTKDIAAELGKKR